MRQTLFVGIIALLCAFTANAQTIKLPTKKTTKKVEAKETQSAKQKEKTLVMPTKPVKEQVKASTQTTTQTAETPKQNVEVPQKAAETSSNQNGTLALPTIERDKTTTTTDAATTTKAPEMVNGVPQLAVIVRRQEAPRAKTVIPKKPKVEDNEIYESAEHMPTYPGGAAELMNFISENMQYPEEALNDSIQGIVQVSFIVEKDGTPTEFEVLDEHHPALEAEAVRIMQLMPKWKPATQNGVKVRVEYVVPVKFALPNNP